MAAHSWAERVGLKGCSFVVVVNCTWLLLLHNHPAQVKHSLSPARDDLKHKARERIRKPRNALSPFSCHSWFRTARMAATSFWCSINVRYTPTLATV